MIGFEERALLVQRCRDGWLSLDAFPLSRCSTLQGKQEAVKPRYTQSHVVCLFDSRFGLGVYGLGALHLSEWLGVARRR